MSEETPADQTGEASSPEEAPEEMTENLAEESEAAETDFVRNVWLLLVVLAVIVLGWVLTLVWDRAGEATEPLIPAYDGPPPTAGVPPDGGLPPAPPPAARQPRPRVPAGPPVSRVVGSDREIIQAAPAMSVAPGEVAYRMPRLFDVTDRAEGFELKDLLRLPGRWADQWPSKSIADIPDPAFAPASEVADLGPADRVVMIAVGSVTRAYTIQALRGVAVVRDDVGETPIVICWSTMLQRAQCLVVQMDEGELALRDAGLLYKGATVVYDEATGSLWDPTRGRALTGPHAGSEAQRLPVEVWPWESFKAVHPDTPVLTAGINPQGPGGAHAEQGLQNYLLSPGLPMVVEDVDAVASLLPPKAYVLGVVAGGEAKAYPLVSLDRGGIDTLDDTVGGVAVQVKVTSSRTGYATAEGELAEAATMLWFAWKDDHPATQLYELPEPGPAAPAEAAAPDAPVGSE